MAEKHTPPPWATDGRFIVQEVDGRSFWSGQPFIADTDISGVHRSQEERTETAHFIVRACNAHCDLVEARNLLERVLPWLAKADEMEVFKECVRPNHVSKLIPQIQTALTKTKGIQ